MQSQAVPPRYVSVVFLVREVFGAETRHVWQRASRRAHYCWSGRRVEGAACSSCSSRFSQTSLSISPSDFDRGPSLLLSPSLLFLSLVFSPTRAHSSNPGTDSYVSAAYSGSGRLSPAFEVSVVLSLVLATITLSGFDPGG